MNIHQKESMVQSRCFKVQIHQREIMDVPATVAMPAGTLIVVNPAYFSP
jgi:hypothetical protein